MKARSNKLTMVLSGLALAALCSVGFPDASTKKGGRTAVPVAARTSYRLGNHVNPVIFNAYTQPVLGRDWVTRLTLDDFETTTMSFVAVSSSFRRPFGMPAGELLIDTSQMVLLSSAARDRRSAYLFHSIAVPSDSSLMGMKLVAQAALVVADRDASPLIFTNGLDLRLGFDDTQPDAHDATNP